MDATSQPKQPGVNAPEMPGEVPETPDTGGPRAPGREVPGIPRPEPELPGRRPATPESPRNPNTPGE